MKRVLSTFVQRASRLALASLLVFTQLAGLLVLLPAQASAADTGFKSPTVAHAGGWGVNATPLVSASDDTYAFYTPGDPLQRQQYSGFGLSVPVGSTIDGVEIQAEAKSSNNTFVDNLPCRLGIFASWDGGTNWTPSAYFNLSQTDQLLTHGGTVNDLGHVWTADELSDSNFVIGVQDNDPGNGCDDAALTHLDYLAVRVHYTPPATLPATGSITIVKDAQPNSLQDFDFEAALDGGLRGGGFTLDDDEDVEGADDEFDNQLCF